MNYDLELEKAESLIKKHNAKTVLIQLPDGLKMYADKIVSYLQKNTNAQINIWAGSCFGACDLPLGAENIKTDLLIQWGHSEWKC